MRSTTLLRSYGANSESHRRRFALKVVLIANTNGYISLQHLVGLIFAYSIQKLVFP